MSVRPKFLASVFELDAAGLVLRPEFFCAKVIKANKTKDSVMKIFFDMVLFFFWLKISS
jgi:hypothetical protein